MHLPCAGEYQLWATFDAALDLGEASCLALAVSRQLIFVTDDLAARRLSKANGVPLTGTLGILVALVQHKDITLDEANGILAKMIQQGYRSPIERLDDLLDSA